MSILDRDVRRHDWSRVLLDREAFWLATLSIAAVGSWAFALIMIAQDNALP